jgi:hypothetical protein
MNWDSAMRHYDATKHPHFKEMVADSGEWICLDCKEMGVAQPEETRAYQDWMD